MSKKKNKQSLLAELKLLIADIEIKDMFHGSQYVMFYALGGQSLSIFHKGNPLFEKLTRREQLNLKMTNFSLARSK